MRVNTMSSAVHFVVCWALLFPPVSSLQAPAQAGRLRISSTPPGANITIDGQSMSQRTDSTFVVSPGKHKVSLTGGPGNLSCQDKDVDVPSGQQVEIHCSGAGWTQLSGPSDGGHGSAFRFFGHDLPRG